MFFLMAHPTGLIMHVLSLTTDVANDLLNTQSMDAETEHTHTRAHAHTHTHTRLTALFWDYPGKPVPER